MVIKTLQKGSKECDKFAETRRGIQMMEGGETKFKVNMLAASGMNFPIWTGGRVADFQWNFGGCTIISEVFVRYLLGALNLEFSVT